MATSLETIRRLTIIAQSQGVDALVNEMRSLDAAQRAATASSPPLAKTTDDSARRALSAAGAFDRMRRALDEEYRASVLAEKGLRTISAALDQGAIDATQAAAAVDLLNKKYQPVAPVHTGQREAAAEAERMAAAAAKLKAELDPLAAAQARLNAEIAEYTTLQRAGLISAEEMARAEAAAVARYGQTAGALQGVSKTGALAQHEVTNLGAQLTDIGVSLAGGQSPFLVMAQQGSTVASILGARGLGASVAAVGTGLLALINPTTLFLAGITAAGYAGYYAFRLINGEAESLEQTLETHERLTKLIADAYDDATYSAGRFLEQSKEVTLTEAVRNAGLLRAELDKIVAAGLQTDRGLFSQLGGRMSGSSFLTTTASGGTFGAPELSVASDFEAYRKPIEAFIASVKQGAPDVKRLRDEVAALANASGDPAVKELGQRIISATAEAAKFARGVDIADANIRRLNGTMTQADRILLGLSDAFSSVKLDAAGRLAPWSAFIQQDENALRSYEITVDKTMERMRQRQTAALASINARSPGERRQAAVLEASATYNDEESVAERRLRIEQAGALAYAQASRSIAESDRERLRALRETIATEELNLTLIGKGIAETESLQFSRQQLAQAEAAAAQNGTTVTKAYREEIERTADAYGRLKLAVAERSLIADLGFERAQIGRSDTEQRVASQLRSLYGEDYTNYMDGAIAGMIRYNDRLDQVHEAMQSFASDLRQSLANGADFWTALGDAAGNTLDTLLDKLTTLATDQVFSALVGGSGAGAGGGLFGSLLSMLGLGGIGVTGSLYASGGYTGAGGRDEPAGIVHRGEYVFDAASVSRIGVGALEALRAGSMPGYADGGYVDDGAMRYARTVTATHQAAANAAATPNAPQVTINVVNNSGESVATSSRKDSSGKDVIDVVVGEVGRRIARGQLDSALKGRFGVKPTKVPGA